MTLRVTAIGDGNKTVSALARTFEAQVSVWMLRDHYATPMGLHLEADPKTGVWTLFAADGPRRTWRVIATGTMTHRGINFTTLEGSASTSPSGDGLSEGDL